MEAIEPTCIGHEIGSLGLEGLPDSPGGELWIPMSLGVGDTFIEQPGVQLVQCLEAQPRVKKRSRANPTCPFSQPDAGVHANRIDQIREGGIR